MNNDLRGRNLNSSKDSEMRKKQQPNMSEKKSHCLLDISFSLEENMQHQLKVNFKWYKHDFSKYHYDEWTVGEEINKPLLLKRKNYSMDTTLANNAIYKGSEIIRTQGRAATEIFKQLNVLSEEELYHDKARQVLEKSLKVPNDLQSSP